MSDEFANSPGGLAWRRQFVPVSMDADGVRVAHSWAFAALAAAAWAVSMDADGVRVAHWQAIFAISPVRQLAGGGAHRTAPLPHVLPHPTPSQMICLIGSAPSTPTSFWSSPP